MICPNCGRDCENANFCSGCGQKLQSATEKTTYKTQNSTFQEVANVHCPKCLSTNYVVDKTERKTIYYRSPFAAVCQLLSTWITLVTEKKYGLSCICLECGCEWFPKVELLHQRYRLHVSKLLEGYAVMKYPGLQGVVLSLEENRLVFCRANKRTYAIPFRKIRNVDFRKGMGLLYGRLTIRDTASKNKPFPKTLEKAKKDKYTVLFDGSYADSFYELSCALNAIIEENEKSGLC